MIEAALQPVEADDVCAHLRQRHAAQRRRHKGRTFNDSHPLKNLNHGVLLLFL